VDDEIGYRRGGLDDNDIFNRGTVWITGGTYAGTMRMVKDYSQTGTDPAITGTITIVGNALAGAVADGDTYSVARSDYPLDVLKRSINQALQELPPIPQYHNDSDFVTVANQLEYTLPTGVQGDIIHSLEMAASTTTPWWFVKKGDWWHDATKLYFHSRAAPQTAGYRLRLMYSARPTDLSADSDACTDLYNPALIVWKAAVIAAQWRVDETEGADEHAVRALNRAEQKYQIYEREFLDDYPPPRSSVKYREFGFTPDNEDVTKVRL
jgi:hypothetical protein